MTIRNLSYKDIPLARRREAVSKTRMRLQERMSDRTLTQEQRDALLDQVGKLDLWASGDTEEEEVQDNG